MVVTSDNKKIYISVASSSQKRKIDVYNSFPFYCDEIFNIVNVMSRLVWMQVCGDERPVCVCEYVWRGRRLQGSHFASLGFPQMVVKISLDWLEFPQNFTTLPGYVPAVLTCYY